MAHESLGDEPLYNKTIAYLAKGYIVAAVPIKSDEDQYGLFAIAESVKASPLIEAAAKSKCKDDRVALAISMIFTARADAQSEGFTPLP